MVLTGRIRCGSTNAERAYAENGWIRPVLGGSHNLPPCDARRPSLRPRPATRRGPPWIGKRAITHYGTVLQVDGKPVDDEGRGKNLARGKDQNTFRVYKVEHANGPWLWLAAEGSGVKGWALAANVVPLDQAVDYITTQIRANPADSSNYNWRGNVWEARKEVDIAIGDYNEAIRLDPGDAIGYHCRGVAWRNKKEYDKAVADFNEAVRLDPKNDLSRLNIAIVRLLARQAEVIADARSAIEADGWKGENAIYAVIVGHLGARREKKDEAAKEFLDDADRKADKSLWPYPVVKYLRREIDEKTLLELSTDGDKMTGARCYLALDQLLNGQTAEARKNFQWVKDHGTPTLVPFGIAAAELDRLDKESPGVGR